MKLKEVIEVLERTAPQSYAMQWDNVGLMIGDVEDEINKVLLTLDITADVVQQAVEGKCDLIISHHPFFFDDCKKIDFATAHGKMIKDLIINNIDVYSGHTNIDAAACGINSTLAEMFGLKNIAILQPNNISPDVGIGRIGDIPEACSLLELCSTTKELLKTPCVRLVTNDDKKMIKRICVASGSCGDLIELAKTQGADVIITGDVKYHEALHARDIDMNVIDAGHFPTEFMVVDVFEKILSSCQLEIIAANIGDCFKFI